MPWISPDRRASAACITTKKQPTTNPMSHANNSSERFGSDAFAKDVGRLVPNCGSTGDPRMASQHNSNDKTERFAHLPGDSSG